MMKSIKKLIGLIILVTGVFSCQENSKGRVVVDFTRDWQFIKSDTLPTTGKQWRTLDLPHDWSIEGSFSEDHPAGVGGGALPGGIGWYKKNFTVDPSLDRYFLQFDGVYQNSTVWVNGDSVGTRPNGYISFEYDITPYVKPEANNEVLVRVKNSPQPNSRWYSGSGIYREVRLVQTKGIYIPNYGVYVKPELLAGKGQVSVLTDIINDSNQDAELQVSYEVISPNGESVYTQSEQMKVAAASQSTGNHTFSVQNPKLWSIEEPHLYQLKTTVSQNGTIVDISETPFGIRSFRFDVDEGFFLNGESVKIKGVCLHHDLGALGAAFNKRAAQRQLEIMQGMGVNSLRTAHNPPAPEVLDLCDEMGILVMDEMFDMWSISKTEHDYSMYWEEWHEQDLRDFIRRDRNHPSIIVWSIGNEIMEQYNHEDSLGGQIASELAGIVRELDARPLITANNDISPDNTLIKNGGLDLVGYNYHHENFTDVPKDHPGRPFIATETNSSLATRGHYDMPSDSVMLWPESWDKKFEDGNPDNTVSAYDHVRTPWGSTQEDTWRIVKNNDFISGLYIWTGFDYIGEPTPYEWPSRSSYFGIVDLAGFPKDTYYMYQSEWTEDTVLHVFPHWNWDVGQTIDVWTYYNHADEVELYLNGVSQGVRSKGKDDFHVMWRLTFEPGEVRVISRKEGKEIASKTIRTAGTPASIQLEADRTNINADGKDLSFVNVSILDSQGNVVPYADNLVHFNLDGPGEIVGVDNGDPTSHLSLKGTKMNAMAGKCMVIIQSTNTTGTLQLSAKADGISVGEIEIHTNHN